MTTITCVLPVQPHHREILEKAIDKRGEIRYVDAEKLCIDDIKDSEIILGNNLSTTIKVCVRAKDFSDNKNE